MMFSRYFLNLAYYVNCGHPFIYQRKHRYAAHKKYWCLNIKNACNHQTQRERERETTKMVFYAETEWLYSWACHRVDLMVYYTVAIWLMGDAFVIKHTETHTVHVKTPKCNQNTTDKWISGSGSEHIAKKVYNFMRYWKHNGFDDDWPQIR